MLISYISYFFFFFNDTATTEIYTLSLHDALPIFYAVPGSGLDRPGPSTHDRRSSEEHTSELQSRGHIVCRLLLQKKKKYMYSFLYENNKKNKQYYNNRKKDT